MRGVRRLGCTQRACHRHEAGVGGYQLRWYSPSRAERRQQDEERRSMDGARARARQEVPEPRVSLLGATLLSARCLHGGLTESSCQPAVAAICKTKCMDTREGFPPGAILPRPGRRRSVRASVAGPSRSKKFLSFRCTGPHTPRLDSLCRRLAIAGRVRCLSGYDAMYSQQCWLKRILFALVAARSVELSAAAWPWETSLVGWIVRTSTTRRCSRRTCGISSLQRGRTSGTRPIGGQYGGDTSTSLTTGWGTWKELS